MKKFVAQLRLGIGALLAASTVICSVAAADQESRHAAHNTNASGNASGRVAANFHINLLGVLVFGTTATAEIGGEHIGVGARLRWINSGVYARTQIPMSKDEEMVFSYGGGIGARYYTASAGPLSGLFVGPALEVAHTRLENSVARIATVTSLVIPQVEAGYRWRFGSWLVGLGAAAGYALVLSRSVDDIDGGTNSSLYKNTAENKVYGSILGDVGLFF
jgi:hypothetical protein